MKNIIENAKAFGRSRAAMLSSAVVVGVGAIVALAGVSGATGTYDPTSSLTSFADTVGTTAGPIIIAVASALVGLYLLFWGVRYVFHFLRGH